MFVSCLKCGPQWGPFISLDRELYITIVHLNPSKRNSFSEEQVHMHSTHQLVPGKP